MVSKSYICSNLEKLERLFNKTSDTKLSLFYSKLAILELCGWIEITMDDIIRRYYRRKIKNTINITHMEDEVIRKTYGFDYNYHFRRMLIQLIGISGIEKLEKKVDSGKIDPMKAALSSLKSERDKEAHEYIKGTTRRLNAPSTTKVRFKTVYEGLKNIESMLHKIKYSR